MEFALGIPWCVMVIWCGVLGLVVGSFLNVVVYRFHTGKSLDGRSRCLSCGHTLSWLCLFPVASYLALRGRCAYCSARISPRYMLVELLTGGLFALAAYAVRDTLLLAPYLVLMALLTLVIVYDLLHTIIPDEFVVGILALACVVAGITFWQTGDSYALALRALGGTLGFLFFASLWYVSDGRWIGLGDAKLALPLGVFVSFPAVISMLILSFWIGALVSVTLLLVQKLLTRGQQHLPFLRTSLTIKSEIPFAPFLIVGFLLVHFFNVNAFSLIAEVLYGA